MQQVTLRPGDYVATEGMTEDQYHWVVKAFKNAGCQDKHNNANKRPIMDYLEWYLGDLCATNTVERNARELTIEQVLSATNGGGKENDMQNWKPEVGKLARNGNGNRMVLALDVVGGVAATRNLENGKLGLTPIDCLSPPMTEEDEAVKDMKRIFDEGVLISIEDRLRNIYRAGYRKQPQATDDPANWRAGDALECLGGKVATLTVGKHYVVQGFDNDGDPIITYDNCDTVGEFSRYFRFHSRPK